MGTSLNGAEVQGGAAPTMRARNAAMAILVTFWLGRNVPSPKPARMPVCLPQEISGQKGWFMATSLNGADVHGGVAAPTMRARNAPMAIRVTDWPDRNVP